MPSPRRRTTTSTVFRYLLRAIRHFERQARPDMVHYYQDALDLVGGVIYGEPAPMRPKVVIVADVDCPVGHRVPPWKEELLSRPLRRIVKVQVVREQNEYTGAWITHWLEELECGHVHTHYPFMPDESRARRRRCRACQSKQRAVLSIIAAKPVTERPSLCTSAATAESNSTRAAAVTGYSTMSNAK